MIIMQKKITFLTYSIILLTIASGCTSDHGKDKQNGPIPKPPIFINTLTVTKDSLPAEAQSCLEKDSKTFMSNYFAPDNGYLRQDILINNNGYFSLMVPSPHGNNCDSLIPLLADKTVTKANLNFIAACPNDHSQSLQMPIISDDDNEKMLILSACLADDGDEIDSLFYKNKNHTVNLNQDIPAIKDLVDSSDVMFSTDINFLQFDIKNSSNPDELDYYIYNLDKNIMSPAFVDINTGHNITNYSIDNLTDNGLGVLHSNDSLNSYLCSTNTNSCEQLPINDSEQINISNNGGYIYYNDNYNNKLNLLKLPSQEKTENILQLTPNAQINNITNDGALLLINYKNPELTTKLKDTPEDTSSKDAIYSYRYNKLVSMIDIIKAVKLEKNLVDGTKFYGDVQISPNGKFLIFFFGEDAKWNNSDDDSKHIKEIDRIFLPYGIDELLNTITAMDTNSWVKPATLTNSTCSIDDISEYSTGVKCEFTFSTPIDTDSYGGSSATIQDLTDTSHKIKVSITTPHNNVTNQTQLEAVFRIYSAKDLQENHSYQVRTNILNIIDHNIKSAVPIEFTFKNAKD